MNIRMTSKYSHEEKNKLKDDIESCDEQLKYLIYDLLKRDKCSYTQRTSKVLFDLNALGDDTIEQIIKILKLKMI